MCTNVLYTLGSGQQGSQQFGKIKVTTSAIWPFWTDIQAAESSLEPLNHFRPPHFQTKNINILVLLNLQSCELQQFQLWSTSSLDIPSGWAGQTWVTTLSSLTQTNPPIFRDQEWVIIDFSFTWPHLLVEKRWFWIHFLFCLLSSLFSFDTETKKYLVLHIQG